MNIKLKNLLGIFLSLFISHSLWSMDKTELVTKLELLELLPESLAEIAYHLSVLDVLNLLSTCKLLQSSSEKLWERQSESFFGKNAEKYKLENMRWGAVFKEHFLMPRDVLKIDSWTKEELEFAISDERFAYHERHLLKHLEKMVTTSAIFKIDNGKDLYAALVEYDGFFIHATWNAARSAARDSVFNAVLNYFSGATLNSASYAASDAASYATLNSASYAAWNAASDAAWNAASDAASYTARNKTIQSLRIIDIKDLAKIGKASYKLNNLFVLAYISEEIFPKHFQLAFMAAKKILDGDASFNMNKAEIIKIWEENTWGKEVLKSNPYILTLRNVALRWASQIED